MSSINVVQVYKPNGFIVPPYLTCVLVLGMSPSEWNQDRFKYVAIQGMHGFPLYPAMKQIVQSINQKLIDKKCNILYTAASNGSSQLHGKAAKLRWVAKGRLVPSIFGTTKARAYSANAQSRFVLFVLAGVLGPLGILHHTWWLYLCSSRSNARGEVPWRAPCQHKKSFQDARRRRGSCWEKLSEKSVE